MTNPYAPPWAEEQEDGQEETLPNGFRRSDYHEYGISDGDIDFFGLDKPGAPPPSAAGWAVEDMIEELDW